MRTNHETRSREPGLWAQLTVAPHRLMFFGGALQLLLTMSWWSAELLGRYGVLAPLPPTVIAPSWAHVWLMVFSLFTFFIFGFLMTTYPRWMGGEEIARGHYVPAFVLQATAAVVFYPALFVGREWLLLAVGLHLAGWAWAGAALWRVFHAMVGRDRFYETQLNLILLLGWLAEGAYFVWLAGAGAHWLQVAVHAGVWLFLVPLVTVVAHRMLPFFSSCVLDGYRVWQPRRALVVLWVGVLGHTAAVLAGYPHWSWPFDLLVMGFGVYFSYHWGLRRSLKVPLLAVLHVAFAWLTVGSGLYALQGLWQCLGGGYILGRAPLHALTIGLIASMVLAMASRVSLGHSGRPLELDRYTLLCFLGLQGVVLLRVFAELPALQVLLSWSAVGWLVCLSPWVRRYAPMYLRPRIDGRAG